MPNENHHSEGAAGKAAYHRQCCSDGMLSHQGVGDRATEKARLWGCIFAQCADMHPCNTDKYCFGHPPPPCTASPAPQLRAHLRLLVVMIFAKGERNCTGRTVSEHLANRKAGKAHNKHAQMLTFSVARSPVLQFLDRTPYTNYRTSESISQGTLPGDASTSLSMT